MTFPFDNAKPIYLQLMDHFYQRICSGQLKAGDKLPSVRETAVEAGVNPNTVQRTYSEMERKGVIEVRRGQGSFVTSDKQVIEQMRMEISEKFVKEFIESMLRNGFSQEEILKQVEAVLSKQTGGMNE
jgi:GntR family transcriptional regulator